jgi:predicted dithiol-disulfide oxidoreductase (DUF899 family)
MAYADTRKKLNEYRGRIAELRAEMKEIQAAIEPEEVEDYEFSTVDGPVRLSALFGGKEDLIVVHNMGAPCVYCTLWADEINGITDHLENRVALVVSSPDTPEAQEIFRNSRGWKFKMVSHAGNDFAGDMGYYTTEGEHPGWQPGVSVFRKQGAKITRVSDAAFGPGDDFCGLWHLLDLMPQGPNGWAPQYRYK